MQDHTSQKNSKDNSRPSAEEIMAKLDRIAKLLESKKSWSMTASSATDSAISTGCESIKIIGKLISYLELYEIPDSMKSLMMEGIITAMEAGEPYSLRLGKSNFVVSLEYKDKK